MIKKTKKYIAQILKLSFSGAIIYWLISSGKLNLESVKVLFAPTNFILAATFMLICMTIPSERWRMLVLAQKVDLSFFHSFKLTYIGYFFNFVMPGGVGGDVIKAYYLHKDIHNTKVIAASSVLMDRVLGLYAMVILAFIAMLVDFTHVMNTPALFKLFNFIVAILAIGTAGLFVLFSDFIHHAGYIQKLVSYLPLQEKFLKLYNSIYMYGHSKAMIFKVLVLSLISQSMAILFLCFIGYTIGATELSYKIYFLVAPLGFMATAIPISPAGVGVGQAAYYFLFNIYTGTQSDIGPTVITIYQVFTLLVSLLGAVFYIQRGDKSKVLVNSI